MVLTPVLRGLLPLSGKLAETTQEGKQWWFRERDKGREYRAVRGTQFYLADNQILARESVNQTFHDTLWCFYLIAFICIHHKQEISQYIPELSFWSKLVIHWSWNNLSKAYKMEFRKIKKKTKTKHKFLDSLWLKFSDVEQDTLKNYFNWKADLQS